MNKRKCLVLLLGMSLSVSVFAADEVIKEEITPPAPEGALAANQIPSISAEGRVVVAPPRQAVPQSNMPQMMAPPNAPGVDSTGINKPNNN